ncbi:MAG: radical SAM protein [Eggerthellaceae bacterium]|nr:radical SAM protein [Eggerthellaceae bacterium]
MQRTNALKLEGLERQRRRFDRNARTPKLQQLFLEVTPRCNLSCIHCGSRCDEHALTEEVSLDEYRTLLERVREAFGTGVFIAITGGEPMLREDIFELGTIIRDLGFSWGMTTNATLITPDAAKRLIESGLRTVSASIDGMPATHDAVRQRPGSYDAAIEGVCNLAATNGLKVLQVTSVMNHQTIDELDELFDVMVDLPIDSWRLANVEPIGSALQHPEILFQPQDYSRLFSFIRQKREGEWPVSYGCCHYLGLGYEGELRDWFWLCSAGIHIMSITHTGDIASCLDIERRPETIFGNFRTHDIAEVWRDGFEIYRNDNALADLNPTCADCSQKRWCRGDSAHSWDFEHNEPRVCMLRDLPEFIPVS